MDELAARVAALPAVRRCYVDLDGTLLGPGGSLLTGPDGRASGRAAGALVAAADAGMAIVPVSGRRRTQLEHEARLLGLAELIAEAGSITVRHGVVAYAWGACPRHDGDTPHQALVAAGAVEALLEAFPGDLALYEPWHRGREGSVLLHGSVDPVAAGQALAAAGCEWAQLVDNGEAGGWPGRRVRAYHLLPRGVSKAAAVTADLAEAGVPAAQAAAIGDSPADAQLADVVGLCAQVANGSGHRAGVVRTRGAMGDGVAELIDALLRRPR